MRFFALFGIIWNFQFSSAFSPFISCVTTGLLRVFREDTDVYKRQPIAYRSISKQTQDNYDACWAKLEPLYKTKVRDIRTAQMQAILDRYSNPRPGTDKKGNPVELPPMSHSTLSKIKALLRCV